MIRWLFSTVSIAMVIDDHDMHDDWNISRSWVEDMRREPWWQERAVSGLVSYWIYQFIGNLSPRELEESELYRRVRELDDAGPVLREFAAKDDSEREGKRWSYYRDLGSTRLIVMDSRTGRVLEEGRRSIFDEGEWDWVQDKAGRFRPPADRDLGSLSARARPALPGGLERGGLQRRLGRGPAKIGERIRRGLDCDHWGAFQRSFMRLTALLEEIGSGERGRPRPRSASSPVTSTTRTSPRLRSGATRT